MKAVVAVPRELLEMMFTLYKTNKKYDKEYLIKMQYGQRQRIRYIQIKKETI